MEGTGSLLPAMRDYRHIEAYQLTRGLLAGVCCAARRQAASRPLRHAAVAAAASIAEGSLHPTTEGFLGGLEAARAALDEVARELERCRREGQLGREAALVLGELQERATAAVAALIAAARRGEEALPPELTYGRGTAHSKTTPLC